MSAPEFGRPGTGPGARLRAAREERGLSIADVAARTKVRPDLLALIEEGRFAELPEPVFTRSFLRAYASAVGLDPNEIADSYQKVAPPPRQAPRRPSNVLPIIGAVVVVLAVGAGVAYYVLAGLRERVNPATNTTPPSTESEPAVSTVRLTVRTTPPGAIVLIDRVRLGGTTPLDAYPVTKGKARELRVDRSGYQSYVSTIDLTTDRKLDITLQPAPKPTPAKPNTPQTAPATVPKTSGTAAPGTGTTPSATPKPAPPAQTTPSTSTSTTPAPAPSTPSGAQPEAAPAKPTETPAPSQVSLRISGRSWLRVTDAKGNTLYEGIPEVGSSLSFPGPVTVRAGKPSAVSATSGNGNQQALGGDTPVTVTLP